jgi:putative membrane protein
MVAGSGSQTPSPPVPEKGGFTLANMTAGNWMAVVLAILAIAFIVQNRDTVSIDVFHIGIRLPLWLSLSVMFLLGWLSGRFWGGRTRAKP